MHTSLLAITVMIALPIFFPKAVLRQLRVFMAWLERRRTKQERKIARLEAIVAAHRDWADFVEKTRRRLAKSSANQSKTAVDTDHRTLLLAQALAAGERYLQASDRDSFPRLHIMTEQICQRLRQHLKIQRTTQKKGQTTTA